MPDTVLVWAKQVGKQIHKRRIILGLTQEELGEIIGRSKQSVFNHEKALIKIDDLPVYAKALHCPIIDLLPETDKYPSVFQAEYKCVLEEHIKEIEEKILRF